MKKWMLILGSLLLAIVLRGFWENTALETNEYIVENDRIPSAFDGLRIAQVSDLHNGHMGPDNEQVIAALKAAEPDVILITGDLVDSRYRNIDKALDFAREAVKLGPVYYVTGNHEARGGYEELKSGLQDAGVTLLENGKAALEREGEEVLLVGLQDPAFQGPPTEETLKSLTEGTTSFRILLCHRPEMFRTAATYVDLMFSGHVHGGQIRIPGLGGLIGPGQGVLPEYDSGMYFLEESTMVVSRGIGNSLFPLRLGNKPEIVVTILKTIHEK